jgi:hypothetical protein
MARRWREKIARPFRDHAARRAPRAINSTMKFLIPRDLWIPRHSFRTGFRLCFTGKRGIHGAVGLLSQARRLFKFSNHGLSEDLFVLLLINPHKIEAHCRAEIQRYAIV